MSLILHHYDFSNFSEKIRLILGFKNLSWCSVEIPSHLPKPDYIPLTAGYRRTPAMQIGADIYCDTHLITSEIERRFPDQSIYGRINVTHNRAFSECIAPWAEGPLLWPTALYITGVHADRFPNSFHQDRARLHHKPEPTVEQVTRAGLSYEVEMSTQISRIESLLSDGRAFLLGEQPTLADFIVYGAPWLLEMIGGKSDLIDSLPKTRAWMSAVSNVGHGELEPLPAVDAHQIAFNADPLPTDPNTVGMPPKFSLGDPVQVSPRDEYSPARGVLRFVDQQKIIIESKHPLVGVIHVHFPRLGYRLSHLKSGENLDELH